MSAARAWDARDGTDGGRRVPEHVLDSGRDDVHSALVPPGALHHRVTAALANWQLDDAEELLAGVERDPSPYVAAEPAADASADPDAAPGSLGRAWADTLRAELLVRRLRVAGFTLVGDPVDTPPESAEPALDLHAGVAELIDGGGDDSDPRSESASRAALAIALVRSAKAAFDATDDDLQRAAGLARHARIELLSRRIDAAMDEAVEAASLLDPALPPSSLLVDTLGTLAGVLADLELMPLALDYQRRSHEAAVAAAAEPDALDPEDGDPAVVVAGTATRLGELCAELGEGLLDDGAPESATPHFAEARRLAEYALELLPPDAPGLVAAQVVHGWALVGLGEHAAATGPLRAAVRITSATADRAQLASAQLALGRALRRQGDNRPADEHLVSALTLATEHGLPRLRRAALRELCTLHADQADAGRALPYLQAYLSDELDRVDERRTRWVELFGRRKSLLETERAAGQLRRQAYEDPLTHLPNRRYAEARLDGLLSAGAAPALAVVDVDRFKEVNDAIGHPGGDSVLRIVGELLIAGVRDTDEVCRWAGDEYVILLPDTTAEQAERALERTRRKVAAYDWAELGLDFPGHDQRGHRLGRPRRRPAHPVRRRRRRALRRQAQRPRPRDPALRGHPDAGRREPAGRPVRASDSPRTARPRSRSLRPTTPRSCSRAVPRRRPARRRRRLRPAARRRSTRRWAWAAPPSPSSVPFLLPPSEVPAPRRPRRPARSSPRSSGRPAGPPSRCSPWSARRAGSTPTARRWCCAPPPTLLVALASEHDAYTTMDAAAMAAAVGPLPEPRGPRARALLRRRRHPGGRRGRLRRPGHGHRGRPRRRRRGRPHPRDAHRRQPAERRRLPGRGGRAGRLAGHDDRRDDRRPGGGGAHVDRPARRVRWPRRADDDPELDVAGRGGQRHRQRLRRGRVRRPRRPASRTAIAPFPRPPRS